MVMLLLSVTGLVLPTQVFAYVEDMSELVVCGGLLGNLIVQNQSYSTSTRQTLFHTQSAAGTDEEAFAFGGTPQGGLGLAQTSSSTGVASSCGFFTSTATSDLIPPARIGQGFMGTVIADPFSTGRPIFSGIMFPQMTKVDQSLMAPQAMEYVPATTKAGINKTATNNTNTNKTTINKTVAPAAPEQNASSMNATSKPPAPPAPAITPGAPLYHQQNKPFSAGLSWPSGPVKAPRSKVQNMSSTERFLMNTVGRSTTDKAFNGTTSSPTYITPDKALADITPFQFLSDARNMTMPGTQLMNRAWPL